MVMRSKPGMSSSGIGNAVGLNRSWKLRIVVTRLAGLLLFGWRMRSSGVVGVGKVSGA